MNNQLLPIHSDSASSTSSSSMSSKMKMNGRIPQLVPESSTWS